MTIRAQAPARCQTCGTPLLPEDTDGFCWADAPPTKPTSGSELAERVERVLLALERVDFYSDMDAAVQEAVVAVHELRVAWKESPQRRWLLDEARAAA